MNNEEANLVVVAELLRQVLRELHDVQVALSSIDVRTERLEEASVAWERIRPKSPEEPRGVARRKPRVIREDEPDELPDWITD